MRHDSESPYEAEDRAEPIPADQRSPDIPGRPVPHVVLPAKDQHEVDGSDGNADPQPLSNPGVAVRVRQWDPGLSLRTN
jgi:hypothetical protein